jgi:hypothetical protein
MDLSNCMSPMTALVQAVWWLAWVYMHAYDWCCSETVMWVGWFQKGPETRVPEKRWWELA